MKTPSPFTFSPEQLEEMRLALKKYFADELEVEVGDLQVDLFIQFLNDQIGKEYYNLGVKDAIQKMKTAADDLVLLVKD
jgi:uncharacterized protein (DUF2164 family)